MVIHIKVLLSFKLLMNAAIKFPLFKHGSPFFCVNADKSQYICKANALPLENDNIYIDIYTDI